MAWLGFFVGSLVIMYLLMRLILLAFGKRRRAGSSVLIAAGLAFLLSTLLAGFGLADGGAPVFLEAFLSYAPAAIAAVMLELTRLNRADAKARAVASEKKSAD